MAKEKEVKKDEKKVEIMEYSLKLPNGTVIEGAAVLRAFTPNVGKGFQNFGFQARVSGGQYSGNVMIIDNLKQVRI